MSKNLTFEEILAADVDDIGHYAAGLRGYTRWRLLLLATARYKDLKKPIERVKALWLIQVILASAEKRRVPYAASLPIADAVAKIALARRSAPELRRSALLCLALLHLKSGRLSQELDDLVHGVFRAANGSKDREVRDFAEQALSKGGVLSRRVPERGTSAHVGATTKSLGGRPIASLNAHRKAESAKKDPQKALKPKLLAQNQRPRNSA